MWRAYAEKSDFGFLVPSTEVDDFTLYVKADNVTSLTILLKDVPVPMSITKDGLLLPHGEPIDDLDLNPQSHWNYTGDGCLTILLHSGDMSELFIDFETPASAMVKYIPVCVALLMLGVAVAFIKVKVLN